MAECPSTNQDRARGPRGEAEVDVFALMVDSDTGLCEGGKQVCTPLEVSPLLPIPDMGVHDPREETDVRLLACHWRKRPCPAG